MEVLVQHLLRVPASQSRPQCLQSSKKLRHNGSLQCKYDKQLLISIHAPQRPEVPNEIEPPVFYQSATIQRACSAGMKPEERIQEAQWVEEKVFQRHEKPVGDS